MVNTYSHAQRHTQILPWCGWCRRLNGLPPLNPKSLRTIVRAATCLACGTVAGARYCGECLHLQDAVILALNLCACRQDAQCLEHATQDNKENAA